MKGSFASLLESVSIFSDVRRVRMEAGTATCVRRLFRAPGGPRHRRDDACTRRPQPISWFASTAHGAERKIL